MAQLAFYHDFRQQLRPTISDSLRRVLIFQRVNAPIIEFFDVYNDFAGSLNGLDRLRRNTKPQRERVIRTYKLLLPIFRQMQHVIRTDPSGLLQRELGKLYQNLRELWLIIDYKTRSNTKPISIIPHLSIDELMPSRVKFRVVDAIGKNRKLSGLPPGVKFINYAIADVLVAGPEPAPSAYQHLKTATSGLVTISFDTSDLPRMAWIKVNFANLVGTSQYSRAVFVTLT